jgi:Icc-related predicted phosphoesterase
VTRLVLLADTHLFHEDLQVPDGDVLVHAGDLTQRGTLAELARADQWLASLPHRHKLVVAGNHDLCFEQQPALARRAVRGATYLQDEEITVAGLRFWGSPWQPWFYSWAFNLQRGPELAQKWALIPERIDVLVTHGPPAGILDATRGAHAGCQDLMARVLKVRPRLHVFGHIHEDQGALWYGGILFVNATTDECQAGATVLDWPPQWPQLPDQGPAAPP